MTTRIALFSDIHANLPPLDVVLADINRKMAEDPFAGVYCLGDLGGYGAQPNEVQGAVMAEGGECDEFDLPCRQLPRLRLFVRCRLQLLRLLLSGHQGERPSRYLTLDDLFFSREPLRLEG
jgi:hypothetical protein